MKTTWLTVFELAAALKLSVISIRRAYWKGQIPVARIGRTVRFDLEKVKLAIERNGHSASGPVSNRGDAGRRAATSPRLVRKAEKVPGVFSGLKRCFNNL